MGLKKAHDTSGLTNTQKRNITAMGEKIAIERRGVNGDPLLEPTPRYIQRKSDKIIKGDNNTMIVLGRDRPGEIDSGYGNQTGAGTIDIVVGRVASEIKAQRKNTTSLKVEELFVDNNLSRDSSRIYISQKTDVDANFNCADGSVGSSKAKGAIAIKSDAIRIIGNEEYSMITFKTTSSTYPFNLYYRAEYPLGVVELFPVPTSGFTLYLEVQAALSTYTSGTTSVDLPPGYLKAIKDNLAVQISPEYRDPSPTTVAQANNGIAWIKRMNSQDRVVMTNTARLAVGGQVDTGSLFGVQ